MTRTARTRATSAIAAQFATPEAINFMARYARGLICVPMTHDRFDQLHIPMMVNHNDSQFGTPFSVSVEARRRHHGHFAADRARTTQVLIDPTTRPNDLVMPGHVFPLRARDGGVLVRAGQTEATVDLASWRALVPGGRALRDHEPGRHHVAAAAAQALREAA